MNSGFLNTLAISRESSFGGSRTGTAYLVPGKKRFTCQPLFKLPTQKVGLFRTPTATRHAGRYFTGSLELEHTHSDVLLMILESLLYCFQAEANTPTTGLTRYSFRPYRLGHRGTLTFAFRFEEEAEDFLLSGVVIESLVLTVPNRGLVHAVLQFQGAQLTPGGTFSGAALTHLPWTSLGASVAINGAVREYAIDWNAQVNNPVAMEQFDATTKAPTRFSSDRQFTFGGDLSEFKHDDVVAALVRERTETALELAITQGTQSLTITWPRTILVGGTPELLAKTDLPYRISYEGLHDAALNTDAEPKIMLVI